MSRSLKLAALAALVATPAFAGQFNLGREATPAEIAAWDIDVRPDGTGLPEGSGTVADGEEIFVERCAICHGDFGEGVDRWPVLAGGQGTLTRARPVKTIGSYWPYLSTVYDYVQRAMPFGEAASLSNDETYAIVAYLMYVNDLVDDEFVLSKENFTEVRLVNEDNFFMDDRMETEFPLFTQEACMTNCKDTVEITMRARVLDVTPQEEDAADMSEEAETETVVAAAGSEESDASAPEEAAAIDPAVLAAGEQAFKKCKACHQVGEGAANKTGPALNGIVNAAAGSVDGFRYSKPMQAAANEGLVWTEEELAAFLAKPRSYMKGTKMSFAGFKKDEDIAAVIAYLKSFPE